MHQSSLPENLPPIPENWIPHQLPLDGAGGPSPLNQANPPPPPRQQPPRPGSSKLRGTAK